MLGKLRVLREVDLKDALVLGAIREATRCIIRTRGVIVDLAVADLLKQGIVSGYRITRVGWVVN